MRYHCEAFDETGRRIGGFEVHGDTMCDALRNAAKNIEVAVRPHQFKITLTRLEEYREQSTPKGC